MQIFIKTNEQSQELFKDRQRDGQTDSQGRLLRTPSGKPGVQNFMPNGPKVIYLGL